MPEFDECIDQVRADKPRAPDNNDTPDAASLRAW